MILVDIHNAQSLLTLDGPLLEEITRATLESENITAADISIAILDDPAIHELNRNFLDHDYPTDVLSFLLEESSDSDSERRIEGEVIISAETAARNSADFHWSPHDELVLYLVHGLLHLAGHDDRTAEDRTAMRNREQEILARWNLQPCYHDPSTKQEDGPINSRNGFLSSSGEST